MLLGGIDGERAEGDLKSLCSEVSCQTMPFQNVSAMWPSRRVLHKTRSFKFLGESHSEWQNDVREEPYQEPVSLDSNPGAAHI